MEVETGKNGTVYLGKLRVFLLRDITAGTQEQIQFIFDRMDTRQRRTVAWDLNFSFLKVSMNLCSRPLMHVAASEAVNHT